jgi:hypothetical protein
VQIHILSSSTYVLDGLIVRLNGSSTIKGSAFLALAQALLDVDDEQR